MGVGEGMASSHPVGYPFYVAMYRDNGRTAAWRLRSDGRAGCVGVIAKRKMRKR